MRPGILVAYRTRALVDARHLTTAEIEVGRAVGSQASKDDRLRKRKWIH